MLRAADVEDLRRRLVLDTYPSAEESAARLRDAGWLVRARERSCIRVSVSNGTRTVTADGDNSAEAWYRVAQKALQEKPVMTPPLEAIPVPLRADEHGGLRIGKTRVLLETLLAAYEHGADPESIVRAYDTLDLADVYAVIAWHLRHKPEVDEYLRRRQAEADELRQKIEASQPKDPGLRERLLARRAEREQQKEQESGHACPRS
jgi:uncharacterized protein (DUF433 family)